MPGVGPLGGYGPAAYDTEDYASDYPPGPIAWNAGLTWPLRASKRVYAADLNQQLSQPVAFLARKPIAHHQQLTAQSIASASTASSCAITMDNQIIDPWYMRSVGTDSSQLVVRTYTDGLWLVQGCVPFAASVNNASYYYEADIYVNGSVYTKGERWASLGSHVTPAVADIIPLPAGTSVQLYGYQNSGSTVSTFATATAAPSLSARWLAANNVLPGGQMAPYTQTYPGPNGPLVVVPTPVTTGPVLTPPSPGTWTTLQEATSSQFNSDIRNNVLYMANVPVYRAIQMTAQSIPASTNTGCTNMQIETDNWGAGSSTVWTCPVAGVYLVGGQVAFATQSSPFYGWSFLICDISGTTNNYIGNRAYGQTIGSMTLRTMRFSKGDTVQLGAWSQTAATTVTGSSSRLFTVWLSQ